MNKIILAENLEYLKTLPDESVDLIYIDPPFNTGKIQKRQRIKAQQADKGDRTGFGGHQYITATLSETKHQFDDSRINYMGFLLPRIKEGYRILKPNGSFFLHLDYREVHNAKAFIMDPLFGSPCFQNEIIWAYDFGGRSKKRWSAKHDNILWYTKHPKKYTFNYEEMERIPYMAPGLVGPEKAKRGKTPTDVWWHTIVPTNSKEKAGYPTQKPLGILKRIVSIHSNPGDHVLDFFAGSATTGEAAALLGRQFTLVDSNPDAVGIAAKRLQKYKPKCIGFDIKS